MKTDALFYELFRIDPHSLFDLVQLPVAGHYAFDSITIKTTEKRLDGFFKRIDGEGPHIFVEVQGYQDSLIYWRLLRELGTYYEQTGSTQPFIAIVLFLDEQYQPDHCPITPNAPNQWLNCTLEDSLQAVADQRGILTVLKPLTLSNKKQLPKLVPRWSADLRALKLSKRQIQTLLELLEYAILKRFPSLTLTEVEHMIHLSPLEDSVAVQELIQRKVVTGRQQGLEEGLAKGRMEGRAEGLAKGRTEGRAEGKLIGQIHQAQRLLNRPRTSEKTLLQQPLKELRALLKQLEAELS